MSAFLEMGGYAGFVWPAYGIALVVMAGIVIQSLRDLRAQRRFLAALEADGARKRAPARSGPGS